MPSRATVGASLRAVATDRLDGVAVVTGGGRGIGAGIARELAVAGMQVAVTGRTSSEVRAVAEEIGGLALTGDVTVPADVARWVAEAETALGPVDLLVANAGTMGVREQTAEVDPADWWRVFEVNVLGVMLCCRAVLPGMAARGGGRIVVTGSGASYLPVASPAGGTAYGASKAAVGRFAELLAAEVAADGVRVFLISPGLVRTAMTERGFPEDAPWTPAELAPRLVRVLASGRADALAGRYLHAEHDDLDDLLARTDEVLAHDLNAIRLRR